MIEKEETAFLKRSAKDEMAIQACNDAIELLEDYCNGDDSETTTHTKFTT